MKIKLLGNKAQVRVLIFSNVNKCVNKYYYQFKGKITKTSFHLIRSIQSIKELKSKIGPLKKLIIISHGSKNGFLEIKNSTDKSVPKTTIDNKTLEGIKGYSLAYFHVCYSYAFIKAHFCIDHTNKAVVFKGRAYSVVSNDPNITKINKKFISNVIDSIEKCDNSQALLRHVKDSFLSMKEDLRQTDTKLITGNTPLIMAMNNNIKNILAI